VNARRSTSGGPLETVNPEALAKPVGYSHGMRGCGELLFVAGQVGFTRGGQLVSSDLVAQFAQALDNVLDVVWAAGGTARSLARLTIYVTSKEEYRTSRRPIGEAYRQRMGRHYPAMTLVEVRSLLEDGAKVEIEATAIL
jgi:enamine deaminase RidA (YjgF/YER057c/UK114 family)